MATCSKCKREIWWKKNADTGSMIPVDPLPDPSGSIVLIYRECRPLKGEELAEARADAQADRTITLYTNHFATCGRVPTAPA